MTPLAVMPSNNAGALVISAACPGVRITVGARCYPSPYRDRFHPSLREAREAVSREFYMLSRKQYHLENALAL